MDPKPALVLSLLNDFLDYWSAREDSYIPPERRLEILRIAQQLSGEESAVATPTDLVAWLPPLLCRSREQQERFTLIYQEWRQASGVSEEMSSEKEILFPAVAPQDLLSPGRRWAYLIGMVIAIIIVAIIVVRCLQGPTGEPKAEKPLLTISNLQLSDSQLEQSAYIYAKNWQDQRWTAYRFDLIYDTNLLEIEVDPLFGTNDVIEDKDGRIMIRNGNQSIRTIRSDSIDFARLTIHWLGAIADRTTTIEFDSVFTNSYLKLGSDSFLTQMNGELLLDGATVNFTKEISITQWRIISGIAGIFLLLIYWYFNHIRRSEVTLNKRLPKGQEEAFLSSLFFPRSLEGLSDLWTWLPQVGQLQNWPVAGRKHFDVAATVKTVSANAGNFVPVFTPSRNRPGFLLLVDRYAQRDQQAELSNALIDKLEARNVRVARYEFDEDPRQLWDSDGVETSIDTLATNYRDHYLVVFSSLSGLYNVYTGDLHEWANIFSQSWSQSYVFSPENPRPGTTKQKLGRYELLSRLGFQVYPLTSIGIRDFIVERTLTVDNASENALSHYLPVTILNNWSSWSSTFSPSDSEITILKNSLKHYLGNDGFRWLQACAPFPELHLELTIYLGRRLGRIAYPQESLYDYAVLIRLLQLPWFRVGSMPKWLRETLIDEIDQGFKKQLNSLFNEFFTSPLQKEEKTAKSLAVYESQPWWHSVQDAILFRRLRKRQAPHSPLREVIFADFVDDGVGARIKRTLLQATEVSSWSAPKQIPTATVIPKPTWWQLLPIIYFPIAFAVLVLGVMSYGLLPLLYIISQRANLSASAKAPVSNHSLDTPTNNPESTPTSIWGHPPQLFVLFFTEMWERFSYYGMRALFVLFLTSSLLDGGFGYSREFSIELYGIYTGLVYFTPLIGGILADRLLGYRNAIVIGALIMTMGHASLAFEMPFFFYLGCLLLIIGNGLFKPNISSCVSQLYSDEDRKDGAYTIFYMGINAGAFLGILLCGYIGERVGWSWGFGLAGVFTFFGMLQFYFAQNIFGKIGLSSNATKAYESANAPRLDDQLAQESLPAVDSQDSTRALRWGSIGLVIGGLIYYLTDYYNGPGDIGEWMMALIFGAVIAFIGWIVSDSELKGQERDRVWVIVILSFFIIFFWWAFEQAGGSMTVFARDYTDRTLTGSSAKTFKIANTLLTVGPMIVITYVFYKLFSITFKDFAASNLFLGTSFVIVWGVIIWMLYLEFSGDTTEVQASWFGILNSFFIITLAPLFRKFWDAKIIRSGPLKFSFGLILLGIGFSILAYGSMGIPQGAQTASVSMVWLILAYLFHTMGELCLSPVGLSYVSKLAPVRLVGLMFGVFFVANFVANYTAGISGSYIDRVVETYNMSTFFLIFTLVPIGAGLILILINPILKKMMHGIE